MRSSAGEVEADEVVGAQGPAGRRGRVHDDVGRVEEQDRVAAAAQVLGHGARHGVPLSAWDLRVQCRDAGSPAVSPRRAPAERSEHDGGRTRRPAPVVTSFLERSPVEPMSALSVDSGDRASAARSGKRWCARRTSPRAILPR